MITHEDLHKILQTHPLDYAPYGDNGREAKDCSCGCLYFVKLAPPFDMDWGVCSNPASHRAGLLTFEHQGCPNFTSSP